MNASACIGQLMALSTLAAGRQGTVHALIGGHEFGSRVANLGFTPGAALKVLQNRGHGPVLISLRGTLVALGRAEAAKVLVREVVMVSSCHSDGPGARAAAIPDRITVALAGQPNVGKTTVFNMLTGSTSMSATGPARPSRRRPEAITTTALSWS